MKKDKYIPINKGHSELDTPERIEKFHEKLSAGWEKEYAEYRRLWQELPKNRIIREYPLLVDLELSSICNLSCPMCPTVSKEYKRRVTKGLMDYQLATKVIDEVAGKVFSLRLSLVGEPTLNPRFIDIIKYAKDHGIKEISFLTNGSKLDTDFFIKLVKAGADWISISIDGLHEVYNSIRKPLDFNDTLNKLRDIKKFKDQNSLIKPVIKVQSIWPAIRSNPGEYYDVMSSLVDLVAYNPLIDYLENDSEEIIICEDNFACPQLYQRIVVCSDGNIKMCSNDEYRNEIVGNAMLQTIYEVWHGEELNRIREKHNQINGFLSIETCRRCYLPRKTEDCEIAQVNGREFSIKNYVHRKRNSEA
jgi:radical SAM protein with 4Fe4S-binding SPASM domain